MNVNDIYINNVYVIVFIILHYLIGQGGFCYWYNQLPRFTNMMHAISEKDGKICKDLLKKLCKNLNVYIKYNSWTQTGILIKVTIKWATTNCQEFYLKDYPHNKADFMDKEFEAQGHTEKQFKSWPLWFQSHSLLHNALLYHWVAGKSDELKVIKLIFPPHALYS